MTVKHFGWKDVDFCWSAWILDKTVPSLWPYRETGEWSSRNPLGRACLCSVCYMSTASVALSTKKSVLNCSYWLRYLRSQTMEFWGSGAGEVSSDQTVNHKPLYKTQFIWEGRGVHVIIYAVTKLTDMEQWPEWMSEKVSKTYLCYQMNIWHCLL